MDRGIPFINRLLHEREENKAKERLVQKLNQIKIQPKSDRLPDSRNHMIRQARLRKMLKEKSRKHRISQERQDEINHENKLLYEKMTKILREGAGNVSP